MKNSRLSYLLVIGHLILLSDYGVFGEEIYPDKRIIIIGAGPAGVAAASKLFEHGFKKVTILEAENRIGGRLYTTKLGNYSIDLGAQWVHGEKNNVVFNLAHPLGLLDTNNNYIMHEKIFDSSGNILSSSINKNMENFVDKYFIDGAPDEVVTSAESYGEFVRQTYDQEFQNVSEMMNHKNELLHHLEVITLAADSGDSWDQVSVKDTDGYVVEEGNQEVNWKTKGYGSILDILMKRIPNPEKELPIINNTRLNTEVTSIDYSNNRQSGGPIIVTTADNRTFEADHVIVTVSLGVLKAQHKTLFTPSLSPEKDEAIEILGFGSAGKVYFLFEEPFWNVEGNVHFGFLWNDADRKIIENDPEKMWLLGVEGAETVEHKPKLLEFYIVSKWAKAMETLPENKVYNQTLELLERFLGKTYTIPKPIAMMRTQWHSNPHFRGAYSYRSVESERQHIHPKILQESITPENLKILFAGEATSPHRFSTADGAVESGWTAADSLIKLYKALRNS